VKGFIRGDDMSKTLVGRFKIEDVVEILKLAGYTKNEIDLTINKIEKYVTLTNDILSELSRNKGMMNIPEFIAREIHNIPLKRPEIAVITFLFLSMLEIFDRSLLNVLVNVSMRLDNEPN